MRTRIKLWRKYREEINNNIKLQEAVNASNEKLTLLNKRLLEVFPNYNEKFKFNLHPKNKNFFKEINQIPYFSSSEIDKLAVEIKKVIEFSKTFKAIEEMDFSSHELDDIIKEIKHRNDVLEYNDLRIFEMGIVMSKSEVKDISKNSKEKIQIAIDGPSGSGKSTIAQFIAKKYNLKYINTGSVYRAIALNAIENNVDLNDEEAVFLTLRDEMIELIENEKIILNGIDVTSQLRSNKISQSASKISIHKKVRAWATAFQKKYAQKKRIIMDGRDTTFNIMPHANIKIFLETSAEERARRRSKENATKGLKSDFKNILKDIKERDYRDRNRKVDPLHRIKEAHLINATKLSIEQVVKKISIIIEEKLHNE